MNSKEHDLELKDISIETLNAIPLQIAVISNSGEIITFNNAWQDFAYENGVPLGTPLNVNYLDVCSAGINKSREA